MDRSPCPRCGKPRLPGQLTVPVPAIMDEVHEACLTSEEHQTWINLLEAWSDADEAAGLVVDGVDITQDLGEDERAMRTDLASEFFFDDPRSQSAE